DRIAAIGLDPVARPYRHQRGRHNCAVVSKSRDLPLQAVATRTGLVADPELAVLLSQSLDQAPHSIGLVGDLTMKALLARASRLGHGDRDLGLVRIQADAHRPILSQRLVSHVCGLVPGYPGPPPSNDTDRDGA